MLMPLIGFILMCVVIGSILAVDETINGFANDLETRESAAIEASLVLLDTIHLKILSNQKPSTN